MKKSVLVITIALYSIGLLAKDEFVQSAVTIHIVDQSDRPLSNAIVSVNSYTLSKMQDGLTDARGVFSYTDRIAGDLVCRVFKEGYYETHGGLWGGPHKFTDQAPKDFTVVLKRIIQPSPMTFHHIEGLFIPELNDPVAFDFEVGDWVEPIGKGKNKDVWMTAQYRKGGARDYDMSVTLAFSNELDGIQEFIACRPAGMRLASDLMPPQVAPESGYTNLFTTFSRMRPNAPIDTSWTENRNHIFRVRVCTNETGKIVAANGGWMVGDIDVGVGANGKVGPMFSYYYNPNPKSRSLEPLDADKSRRRK